MIKDNRDRRIADSCGSFPKTIWMLWYQGWENAPELVKRCRRSWQY